MIAHPIRLDLGWIRETVACLPEVTEADHHGCPSFRVAGKIIATVPDGRVLNVMVGEDEARAAVAEYPAACSLLWWGRRLVGVRVDLDSASAEAITELLGEAWHRRAPAQLRRSAARRAVDVPAGTATSPQP